MSITEIFEAKCKDNSDICEHMPILKEYAEKCETIVELGVRSIVSTWAFLAGKPKQLISVDIQHPSYYKDYDANGCNLDVVQKLASDQLTRFYFVQHDSKTIKLPPCDLIFFDTLHTYEQLSAELLAHGNNAKKYLIFHDTETYKEELIPAITEFIDNNNHWYIDKAFKNNNGILILKRLY
jgi:hypothetical protein